MKRQGRSASRGFTLLELMCVIAIIGILLALMLGVVSKLWAKVTKLPTNFEQGQKTIQKAQAPGSYTVLDVH